VPERSEATIPLLSAGANVGSWMGGHPRPEHSTLNNGSDCVRYRAVDRQTIGGWAATFMEIVEPTRASDGNLKCMKQGASGTAGVPELIFEFPRRQPRAYVGKFFLKGSLSYPGSKDPGIR
jgi:hypothetical protein